MCKFCTKMPTQNTPGSLKNLFVIFNFVRIDMNIAKHIANIAAKRNWIIASAMQKVYDPKVILLMGRNKLSCRRKFEYNI